MLKALFFVVFAASIFLLVSSTDSSTDYEVKSSSSSSSSSSTSSSSSSTASECDDDYDDDESEDNDDDNTTSVCGANQTYVQCPDVSQPRNCSQVGYSLPLPAQSIDGKCPTKPGCVCNEGLVTNNRGVCVPPGECPTCGGDPNARPGCGQNCGRRCSNYNKGPVACAAICRLNACDCKPNFVFDDNIEKCVSPDECTPVCGTNEVYSSCTNGGCFGAKKCSEIGTPIRCVKIDPKTCIKGCLCKEGYLRNANGICVKEEQCNGNNQTCPKNEVYDVCPVKCPFRTCGINDLLIDCIPSPQVGDPDCAPPACRCADGLYRNDKGICVSWEDCPKCTNRNEVYDPCPAPCPPRDCSVDESTIRCRAPPKLGDPECEPGCRCEDGYKKNIAGQCIPKDMCSNCTGPHEYYDPCPDDCPPQVCAAIYSRYNCPLQKANKTCVGSCRCEPGYYRNKRGECISTEDCLKCTGPNEYFSCGGACDNVCSNLSEQNQTSCPIVNIVCNKMCYCEEGYARDANGTCVPFANCAPKPTCGVNEEYSSCANGGCFGPRKCADIGKFGYVCVDLIEGACKGGCLCKEGFYRNDEDVCVPEKECKPTCGVNEEYSSCANGGCYGPRKCADLGGPSICVDLIEGGCKGGCLCKEGFYRNDKDVCVPEKECIPNKFNPTPITHPPHTTLYDSKSKPTCGVNEEYSSCANGGCYGPRKCADLGGPSICVDLIEGGCKGGCLCKEGFYRNDKDVCVPEKECKPTGCGGDPNAVQITGCGSGCRRSCSNYKQNDLICIAVCRTGCDCKPDYVYDDNLQKCVLPSKCTPQCKENEVFSNCTQADCRAVSCKDRNRPVACPSIAEGSCIKGCVCQPDYYRADNGTCVSESECDRITCPDGGVFNTCPPAECDAEYCPKDRNSPQSCRSTRNCGKPRCTCGFNQKRNRKTNECIAIADCPPFKCGGPNEEYQACPPVCPGQNCSDYINNSTCPKFGRIGIVVPCQPQCRCKKNYYRNTEGICVKGSQCRKEAPSGCGGDPNAVEITGCGSGCRRSCSNYKQNNLICPAVCRTGCDCKPDYVYDNNLQKCVLPSECTQSNPEPVKNKPEPVTDKPDPTNTGTETKDNKENALKSFSDGVDSLTISFLNEVMKSNKDKSVAASPFSVTVPLAQLALRTKGSSNKELLRLLNILKDQIPHVFRPMRDSFKNVKDVVFNSFATIYVNKNYSLNEEFSKESNDLFKAEVQSIDCSNSAKAATTINEHVEQNTNNRIKDLVTPDMITSLTRIVLINAIYYKGLWKSQFNRNNTQDRDFYVNKDNVIKVSTMHIESNFRYINSPELGAQILEMPYKNENFTCLFILPGEKYEDLAVTTSKVTPDNMNKAINNMRIQKVKVYLPKFKIETSTDLKDVLQKLGVTGVFNENKPEIVDVLKKYEPLFVSAARQKCFVEMNEEGSEAAAANAVTITTLSLPLTPIPEYVFRADHPFIFLIKKGDTILFTGAFFN